MTLNMSVTNNVENNMLQLIMQENLEGGQTDSTQVISSSTEFDQKQYINQNTTLLSGSVDKGGYVETSLASNSGVTTTTLEVHPDMILGIGEEDESLIGGVDGNDRPHLCTVCQASYKTKTHLRRHMLIHMSPRPYLCTNCGKGFNRKEHLDKHLLAVHSKTKHHCPHCNRKISRLDHLRRHIKHMHNTNKDLKKKSKGKATFLKIQQVSSLLTPIHKTNEIHESNSKSEERTTVKSEGISGNFKPTVEKMTIIPSNILGNSEGIATLAVQSTNTQKVLVHQRLPTGSKIKLSTVMNGLAGLASLSLSLGQQGVDSEASSSNDGVQINDDIGLVQIFSCGECNLSFQTNKELLTHAKVHSASAQSHQCPHCPKAYTRREKLAEHIRSFHEGQRFQCEFCGKNLSRKDHVLRHIRSIHPEVYAASFASLDEGDVTFDDQGRLTNLTGSSSPPSQKRRKLSATCLNIPSIGDVGVLLRSVCHICLKVFGTAYHLTRHMESCHNGDSRPFRCSACDKMFKRKDHLTKHAKLHCPKLKQDQASPSSQNPSKEKSSQNNASLLVSNEESQRGVNETTQKPLPEQVSISNQSEQVEDDRNLRLLADESMSSTDCTHMILQNLQVELDTSCNAHEDNQGNGTTLQHHDNHNHPSNTTLPSTNAPVHPKISSGNDFSVAVIDSFMQGNVNVVVVDEEISSFLRQSSASHTTTTFPCGQCQKEFFARDLLIAHLQEHENDNSIHGHHDQRISDISFSDY